MNLLNFGTMKKFFIFALLMVGMTAGAQKIEMEYLQLHTVDDDPLTGTVGGIGWAGKHVSIFLPIEGAGQFVLRNPDHVFSRGARIGYYSSSDSLLYMSKYSITNVSEDGAKLEASVFFSPDSLPHSDYSENAFYYKKSWRVRPKNIVEWLLENDGYIRLVANTYGDNLFDVRFRLRNK